MRITDPGCYIMANSVSDETAKPLISDAARSAANRPARRKRYTSREALPKQISECRTGMVEGIMPLPAPFNATERNLLRHEFMIRLTVLHGAAIGRLRCRAFL